MEVFWKYPIEGKQPLIYLLLTYDLHPEQCYHITTAVTSHLKPESGSLNNVQTLVMF